MALKLEECRRVFLDSTVISDLLNFPNLIKYDMQAQERLKTVKCLIDTLSANKSTSGEGSPERRKTKQQKNEYTTHRDN
jgi:hypothetical protein